MVEGHPNIKNSTSIIDYIFRLLGFEYLDRSDLVHIKPTADEVEAKAKVVEEKTIPVAAPVAEPVETTVSTRALGLTMQQPKSNAGDALPCTNCGSLALVRNGTCYLCTNCGTTTGCS
jgi:ribonucleoside-diphosphate reductase alpha chain